MNSLRGKTIVNLHPFCSKSDKQSLKTVDYLIFEIVQSGKSTFSVLSKNAFPFFFWLYGNAKSMTPISHFIAFKGISGFPLNPSRRLVFPNVVQRKIRFSLNCSCRIDKLVLLSQFYLSSRHAGISYHSCCHRKSCALVFFFKF